MPDFTTSTNDADLLHAAVRAVLHSQDGRTSRLQRDLRLSYSVAVGLIEQLQSAGILTVEWPDRERALHPDYRSVLFRDVSADEALVYARRVANLAIYCFELAEQDNDAHSELVQMMLPLAVPKSQWREVRNFFRRDCYATGEMTISQAALAFHAWALERGSSPAAHSRFDLMIREECLPYERPFLRITNPTESLNRAYIHMARFFRQVASGVLPYHSRPSAFFIQDDRAPQSEKQPGRTHAEHVVPCAVQRDIACEMFRREHSVYDVAQILKKLHVVIWIDSNQAYVLDNGPDSFRSRMPAGWQPETNCIYARLHDKKIPFNPPLSHPCTCDKPL